MLRQASPSYVKIILFFMMLPSLFAMFLSYHREEKDPSVEKIFLDNSICFLSLVEYILNECSRKQELRLALYVA